jgi:hypothetical protein
VSEEPSGREWEQQNPGCVVDGDPSCSRFMIFSPFVTAIVPNPRVVGIELNYHFD